MVNIPKVTIVMATYNRARFIEETLRSIQNQTFINWECLIIDDGGTDNTKELITPFLEKDNRFQFLKRTDNYKKGLPGCRNQGLDLAKGKYIIFFDDDDIVHPQNLELCVKELSENNFSFCRYIRDVFVKDFNYSFNFSKEYSSFFIDDNDIDKILKHELPFNSCAVMWKASCFTQNRFAENLMYAEEWELYSRMISTGLRGVSINKCLFYGRKHLNSNTGEFFNHNSVRRASNANAITLVIQNLSDRKKLSNDLIRYFVSVSLDYKEYNLFNKILQILDLNLIENLKWQIYYKSYFLRLPIYKIKKRIKK